MSVNTRSGEAKRFGILKGAPISFWRTVPFYLLSERTQSRFMTVLAMLGKFEMISVVVYYEFVQ